MRFVLASASPTRLRVLREAGFDPEVVVSGIDEKRTELQLIGHIRQLAARKARAVAPANRDALVLGCDTVVDAPAAPLQPPGEPLGKPRDAAQATTWLRSMAGRTVVAWTAHHVVLGGRESWRVTSADVRFTRMSDDEIDAYVATGEPLEAAGAFRLGGRAAAFVETIEGDPGTVHGVSVPALREMLGELDVRIADLWV